MAPPVYTNTGRVMYDVAITGVDPATGTEVAIPFLLGSSEDYPYLRESDGGVREQIDTTSEPGEQSLTGYWWRSQASFDLGYGLEYFDTKGDQSTSRRFKDSCGVHVFTPGKVTLLNACSKVRPYTNKSYAVSYCLLDDDGQVLDQGVLVAESQFSGTPAGVIKKITDAGVVSNLLTGTDAIYDLTTDGGFYYSLHDDAVRKGLVGGGSQSTMFTLPQAAGNNNVKRGRIAAVKDRLIVALTQETADANVSYGNIYVVAPTATALGSAVGTVAIPGWRWTGICDGPTAIYLGGYGGDTGRIYALGLNTTANPPTLTSPYCVAELPKGETVCSVISYLSTYLVVGTNKGVRIATINPDASLTMGPLSLKSDTPVWGLCAAGDYVYAGGSSTVPWQDLARPGLWKVNLGTDGTDPRSQLGIFPAARDLYAPDATNPGVNQILRVCPIGMTGRIAFTVDNVGTYFEGTSEVAGGWLKTGRIRFDTQEKKSFDFLKVNRDSSDISVTPSEEHDGAWGTPVALSTVVGTPGLSMEYEAQVSPTSRYQEVRYTFVLTKGAGSGAAFTGYQVRGRPSNVVGRTVRLPLMCFPREKNREGLEVERSTWWRIRALELMEKRGGYLRLQNLATGENEYATFESIQFITTHTQQSRQDQANPGGMLVVTLRLVNLGS